jgi:DNA-directed RNA polymerase subunit RPC12/RpoP
MLPELCLPNSSDGYDKRGVVCAKCGDHSHAKGGVQVSQTKYVCVKCWRFAALRKTNPNKSKG